MAIHAQLKIKKLVVQAASKKGGSEGPSGLGVGVADGVYTNATVTVVGGVITLIEVGSGGTGTGDVSTDTIWSAKGDIVVGTGPDTAIRVAAGANGKVIEYDSSTPSGVKAGDKMDDLVPSPAGTYSVLGNSTFDVKGRLLDGENATDLASETTQQEILATLVLIDAAVTTLGTSGVSGGTWDAP